MVAHAGAWSWAARRTDPGWLKGGRFLETGVFLVQFFGTYVARAHRGGIASDLCQTAGGRAPILVPPSSDIFYFLTRKALRNTTNEDITQVQEDGFVEIQARLSPRHQAVKEALQIKRVLLDPMIDYDSMLRRYLPQHHASR